MISHLLSCVSNLEIVENFKSVWNELTSSFVSSPIASTSSDSSVALDIFTFFETLPTSFRFDDFQLILLKWILAFLTLNILFICVSWKIYGERICDRFMKPATSRAIEELKASVSKLKLPKEHSPRV